MRGKAKLIVFSINVLGITPAYAGKSTPCKNVRYTSKDHPRLCGEKRKLSRLLIFSLGSPPPMRGKGAKCVKIDHNSRITPAYAGKSFPAHSHPKQIQDHPRLCGEKFQKNHHSPCYKGSPPPMRGKGKRFTNSQTADGITPAYAGKSVRCSHLQ